MADDLPLLRAGVAAVLADLGIEDVTLTRTGRDALRFAVAGADLVVVGRVVDLGPRAVLARLRRLDPVPVAVVLLDNPTADIGAIARDGARAILPRGASTEGVAAALERVLAGDRYVDTTFALGALDGEYPPSAPAGAASGLSERERDVLALLARGCERQAIAHALFVSESTVKSHLARIYRKLEVHDRAGAIAAAFAHGIVE